MKTIKEISIDMPNGSCRKFRFWKRREKSPIPGIRFGKKYYFSNDSSANMIKYTNIETKKLLVRSAEISKLAEDRTHTKRALCERVTTCAYTLLRPVEVP